MNLNSAKNYLKKEKILSPSNNADYKVMQIFYELFVEYKFLNKNSNFTTLHQYFKDLSANKKFKIRTLEYIESSKLKLSKKYKRYKTRKNNSVERRLLKKSIKQYEQYFEDEYARFLALYDNQTLEDNIKKLLKYVEIYLS